MRFQLGTNELLVQSGQGRVIPVASYAKCAMPLREGIWTTRDSQREWRSPPTQGIGKLTYLLSLLQSIISDPILGFAK